jgi:hypothetical protein
MLGDFVNSRSSGDFLTALIVFLIMVLVYTLVVRFLWNTVLVKHITVLRPVNTLLDTFLLAIALTIFQGRTMR